MMVRMYTEGVHSQLDKILEWYIGMNNDFAVTSGMWSKYFSKYLLEEYYKMYLRIYSDCKIENFWQAIFTDCELFSSIAKEVSEKLNYIYNITEEESIITYLENIRDKVYEMKL